MAVSSQPQAFAPVQHQILGVLFNIIIHVMVEGQFKKFVMETIS